MAGGSTPRKAYELAAALDGDWGGVDLWYGDDRCVPAYDPLSNQLLVRESLLDRIIVHPTLHPIRTDLPAEEAAAAYDAELRDEPLDLILLGLGSDGHTASLFPDAPTLAVRDRLAVAAEPGLDPFVERVTLTIPALESGAHVVFLAVGESKAEAARRAFAGPPSTSTPASLVRSREGKTTVVLDEAAASLLP
jgi:6-phosphogluconolactonase